MSARHFGYWGKAHPSGTDGDGYHLLPYHCLDVAAVGVTLLKRSPALSALFARALGLAEDQPLYSWFAFVLATHDLGKFAESFQGQRADLVKYLRGREADSGKPYSVRHDTLGWLVWDQHLKDRAVDRRWFGPDSEDVLDGIGWWVRACTGHHGLPPDSRGHWRHHFCPEDVSSIEDFLEEIRTLFPLDGINSAHTALGTEAFEERSRDLAWWFAGVTVLADWIGSNTLFFPYRSEAIPLGEYWQEAQKYADAAIEAVGVLPVPCRERSFAELFAEIARPSPLQAWAIDTPLASAPQIHLLEDVTGAGKTEAAVMLAHRLMTSGCADGFFVALPTMATANAMYGRIAEVYRKLFEGNPSLVLAHGQRALVEAFADSVLPVGQDERDAAQQDDTATARCNAWLADHAKRALLAPAGVGTIDQVLLATLYSKHQSLRLLGLFRKVLIIDEVHACDAYMQRVLETVLTFHAMAGGSVILLSATLPEQMKHALFSAFARGRGADPLPRASSPGFPLVTSWHEGQTNAVLEPIVAREAVCRDVAIRYVADEYEVVSAIRRALAQGKCVCWMRNTVSDVLAAHAHFENELDADHLIVFHARFALQDRLATEKRILTHFGRSSTPAQRAGRLVIASQVAEQSLDADWDMVISDLAPIDRLIQRAGRLQRHPRDTDGARLADPQATDQRGQPCLWVLGPAWSETPAANWYKQAFPKAAAVYPHHGHLWLTARALQQGRIAMPEDARALIEGVFGKGAELPSGLQANANQADGAYFSDLSVAQQNTIKIADGYIRGGIDWWSEAKTPTRLGEASMTVLLARWDGDRLRPWAEHGNPRHAWAYSSVKVAERLIARRVPESDGAKEQLVKDAEALLPDKGKWSVVLALQATAEGWTGTALSMEQDNKPSRPLRWRYDHVRGLEQIQDAERFEQEQE
ncbi:MAG TPA: CRISPR-associated helicase/endonuclease Cas3 [Thauera sp.]|uniref:CRISPR-associated helicase Cas3' n=1 Tax=Thauera sp. WB-2 TaxID=2897772 RepID=UPI000E900F1C|nr:CRISPR-associated helicase Cas3' [Thauera sp. WB-2]WBL63102.1 CRISPR-associated helicase Cas3' [Thauera sp. WB-2]HAY10028.1 CRISPR-associated helicase/endonuclease Cas3 [Thauera sp.]HRJ24392.1 CRISPR-associated helicase Cas3' [Thauera sp.]